MKNNLIIILLLLTSWQTISQNKQIKDSYIPVLADTLDWWEIMVPEFGNYALEHFYTVEKQMYNDTLYHRIYGGWYIEDTTERRIYRKPAPGSNENWEILMYDYSLEEGDSLWHNNYTGGYYWFYVDSIRYIDTYAGPRKAWFLHFDDGYIEHPVWVEEIGSLAGFWRYNMEPRLDWWGWGILNCWYADEELIYKSNFAEQWGCQLEYMSIIEQTKHNVRFYPNPVTDISLIEFENTDCKEYTLTIYNILGKELYTEQTNSDIFQIHASKLNNGIYFYVISAENKILYTDKFIVKL